MKINTLKAFSLGIWLGWIAQTAHFNGKPAVYYPAKKTP